MTKFVDARPFADPDAAARKLIEIAYSIEPVQDGRIHIEKINRHSCTTSAGHRPNLAPELTAPLRTAGYRCTKAAPMSGSRKLEQTCLYDELVPPLPGSDHYA